MQEYEHGPFVSCCMPALYKHNMFVVRCPLRRCTQGRCHRSLFDGIVVDEIVEQGINGKSRYGLDTCLASDILAVSDDSVDGNVIVVSDFLVEHALCDTHQNLLLPCGKILPFRLGRF